MDNPALEADQTDLPPVDKKDTTADAGFKETYIDVDGATTTPPTEKTQYQPATAPYAGMGKEDLLRFSQTPFWSRLRLACLITFWLGWLALLIAVIVLTIVMPRCAAPPKNTWSEHGVIYDIFVPSFYDTDNDGLGDIQGVIEKLGYLEDLGVNAVSLSSVYLSGKDAFSDVINHTQIDSRLGSLDDVRELIKEAHNKGLKVLLDFIPNHTSRNHTWFKASESSDNHTTNPYWNFYNWASCSSGYKPNNWVSVYGGSAWEYSATRGECYFHNFLEDEPELNLRSSSVLEELWAIMRYWVKDIGIDGFRIRSASFLFEDADLRDDGIISGCNDLSTYDCLDHIYTRKQEANYATVNQWRKQMDSLSPEGILAVESSDGMNETAAFYGGTALVGAQLPINIQLSTLDTNDNAVNVRNMVSDWLQATPSGGTSTWASSSSEIGRQDNLPAPALHMLKMTLPGTVFSYYGEELGMRNGNQSGTPKDPAGQIDKRFSRDPYRSPMQWSNADHGGFTNSTSGPWLPVNGDVSEINVEVQQKTSDSPLAIFQALGKLRAKEPALQYGSFSFAATTENTISYIREFNGQNSFLVAINFGQQEETQDYPAINSTIPGDAEVVVITSGSVSGKVGDTISLRSLSLKNGEGIIVKWPYKR